MNYHLSSYVILFDYIYYRIARFYYKKDGIDATRATSIVSLIQGLLLGAMIFFILRIVYGLSVTSKYTQLSGKIGIAIAILLMFLNFLRYKGKYWRFAERWRDTETDKQRRMRGVLVVFAVVLPFIILFWMGTSAYR